MACALLDLSREFSRSGRVRHGELKQCQARQPSRSRSSSTGPRPRFSSSTCSAISWSRAVSAKRSATTSRQLARAVKPIAAVLDAARDDRHAGHPHPRGPSARSVRRAAGQGRARRAVLAHRRSRADGAHPDPRRSRPRHHSRTLSARQRDRDRQAGQGRVLRHRTRRRAAAIRHRESCWSAASPPKSASTPRCAKPTTAAIAASCWPTAAHPTFPNSTRWA